MVQKNTSDCIFCGAVCTCSPEPQRKRGNKSRKPLGSGPVQREAKVQSARPALQQTPPALTGLRTTLTEDELDYRSCVRVLAGIMHHEDKEKVAHILNVEPTHEENKYTLRKERTVEQERINERCRVDGNS